MFVSWLVHLRGGYSASSCSHPSWSPVVTRALANSQSHYRSITGTVPRVFRGNAIQTGTGQVVLPLLGSLASHSCDPNTTRIIAPGGATCEYICTQAVPQGNRLTCSYIGHSVRPTVERQAMLKATKGFECHCPRCSGPDREAALPCRLALARRWAWAYLIRCGTQSTALHPQLCAACNVGPAYVYVRLGHVLIGACDAIFDGRHHL